MPEEIKPPELSYAWLVVDFCILTLLGLFGLFLLLRYMFLYWARTGVSYLTPYFPGGNINDLIYGTKSFGLVFKDLYDLSRKCNEKISGIYVISKPAVIITDLKIIKQILTRDFEYFEDRGLFYNGVHDPIAAYQLNGDGSKWNYNLHSELAKMFTNEQSLATIFNNLRELGENFLQNFDTISKNETADSVFNIKTIGDNYTIQLIGFMAFGINVNKTIAIKQFPTNQNVHWQFLLDLIFGIYPEINFIMKRSKQPRRDLVKLFESAAHKHILKGVKTNPTVFEKLFQQLQIGSGQRDKSSTNQHSKSDHQTDDNILKMFNFILNTFQMNTSLISFAFFELANNPDIQQQLRNEINKIVDHIKQITYQTIQQLPTMQLFLKELLRKYPINPVIERVCTRDYRLPDTKTIINRGTLVFISIYGIHHNSDYYNNPEQLILDRCEHTDTTYLPFGIGNRQCIGDKLALIPLQLSLIMFLKYYSVSTCALTEKTIDFDPKSYILLPKQDIWLRLIKN